MAGSSGLIGHQVVRLAQAAGHEVVGLSRSEGVDVLDPAAVGPALAGVDVLVDVVRAPTMEQRAATDFYERAAAVMGAAARSAGVRRTVVLSIVAIDEGQDYGWYAATLAHERAVRRHAPGPCVLRATQFCEFPGQVLQRALAERPSGAARPAPIMDVELAPIESAEVARALVELAVAAEPRDEQVAGPGRERLVQLVRDLVAHQRRGIEVVPGPAPASMAGGSMLPGEGVPRRGRTWHEWLAAQPKCA